MLWFLVYFILFYYLVLMRLCDTVLFLHLGTLLWFIRWELCVCARARSCVWERRVKHGVTRRWIKAADGWRTKDKKRMGLQLKACPFIDLPPHSSSSSSIIYLCHQFPWQLALCSRRRFLELMLFICAFLCVFQVVLQCHAGGNINNLHLWKHQRQSHDYAPIRHSVLTGTGR